MDIWELGATEIANKVRDKEVSAQEVLDSFLARIAEVEPSIQSYLEVLEADARIGASRVDAMIARGQDPGPLAGVPSAIKDNISVKGAACTCGSKMLRDYVSPYDATVVRRMKRQGSVILGKTNLDEFAMGSDSTNSAFFVTKNPWDMERSPGGSSGGSAAAVASATVPLALGSDTGGSVRQPAAYTGICGLKPTYGRISRYGVVGFAPSLDHVGPMALSVYDLEALFWAIEGQDALDATSAEDTGRTAPRILGRGSRPLEGILAGVPRELMSLDIEPGVRDAFGRALERLSELGVRVREISMPSLAHALTAYRIIASCEASSTLARFDGVRYGMSVRDGGQKDMYSLSRGQGFGPEVKRRIMLGAFMSSSRNREKYLVSGAKIRALVWQDFQRAFGSVDVLLSPTTPTVAPSLGPRGVIDFSGGDDSMTVPANLAGIPALSIPCGFALPQDSEETSPMPCGLQIMGRPFDEGTVFAVGRATEAAFAGEIRERMGQMRRGLGLCEAVLR